MTAALAGFALSLTLIVAIGAQNAFVLRQGLRGSHVFAVCATCAVSDAVLIAAGVAGMGAAVDAMPRLALVLRLLGAAFLLTYGTLRLRAALKGGEALTAGTEGQESLASALATCLAFTWLNPHVYLDTLVLVGSVSTRYPGQALAFGTGAALASFSFFFALGYGAALLRPLFAKPRAWQVLDLGIALVMYLLAGGLILG